MNEPQLELIPATPKLTERQEAVLAAVQSAGHEGIDAGQAGAILHGFKEGRWAHGPDDRCAFCDSDGKTYLKRLAQLELVKYRRARGGRPGAWVTISDAESADTVARGMLRADQDLPF